MAVAHATATRCARGVTGGRNLLTGRPGCYKGRVTAPSRDDLDRPATSDSTARALVAAIPDPIFRIGTDGRYRGFKVDSERDLVTPPDEVIGRIQEWIKKTGHG